MARKKYPEAIEAGKRIRLARLNQGLSMEQLGKKLSPPASKGGVSNWENGYNLPNDSRLEQLSNVLNVSTAYILDGSFMARDIHMLSEADRIEFEKQLKGSVQKNMTVIDSNLSKSIENITNVDLTIPQKFYLTNAIRYLEIGSQINFPDGNTPISYLAAILNSLLQYDSSINDLKQSIDEKKEHQTFYENDLLEEFTSFIKELNTYYSKNK